MKHMEVVRATGRVAMCGLVSLLLAMGLWMRSAGAQGVGTTTVQGTVYLANGQPGGGTLTVRWPAFTTASGQAVAADSLTVAISPTGFLSVNLAPNQGSQPAGEYYTAVYYMSDGTTSTEFWVVPAAATATLAQVRAMVMPAAQAVQAVNKAYVDQAVSTLSQSLLTATGGTMVGPLILSGDPSQPLQAADKHYVDAQVATAVPLAGGHMTGALTAPEVNGVQSPAAASSQTTLQAAVTAAGTSGAVEIPPVYAGTDTFSNPNGVRVNDLRTGGSQPTERSVKEFGAVCDGVTDDTNALQSALNYANADGVALTIPEGTCKTRTLNWHGESIGGLGKQVSALMGFPGQDVLASAPDSMSILSYTRLHDLTIYVDQSVDASCSPAEGRAAAGACQISRVMERNSIFSPGGNGLNGTAGSGAGWAVGNCAIAMPAATGLGGNGLKVAEIENLEIATTGADPQAARYPGAHSTHTCGMYLAQWPQWSEFRNIDIRGVGAGIAIPALPGTTPAGLNADSNRWQNITVQAVHGFTVGAGSNNVLDNVVALVGNAAAMAEPPTGLVLDFAGNQQGWTVRNAVVLPSWTALQPALTVAAAGGAVAAVSLGTEHGLGWDPYGTTVALAFSGSCTAQATASVNSDGSIGTVTVTQGGTGCSATTTASVNAAGTWDTAAPVNLISGQNQSFFAGSLLKGSGGYTVWNAAGSKSFGTQLNGGGGILPGGGSYAALVGNGPVGSVHDVDQFAGADFGAKLQACVNSLSASYGGTCDARNFTGSVSMGSNVTIAISNATVLLPCATITTASQILVTAGTRNVSLRGCALRGGTAASGSAGGTAIAYSGTGAAIQVGDATYAVDTTGFHMDNAVINTTAATAATAQAIAAYRTQELDLDNLYLLGNLNQTGVTLDGTGNYTGGTLLDDQVSGFQTAVNALGHQAANAATTDWLNASTFVRLHVDCPTSSGSPIAGTYGINLQAGDGNTFTGGDVENCATALHLGANAQNNTIVGLRNENSMQQVVADAGSQYNSWITGGTMFAGKLTDNGTHNSFLDSFHRGFNGLNGDIYRSQSDATITNHWYLGTGAGNVRGLQDEYFTDVPGSPGNYQAAWEWGPQDGSGSQQTWALQDMLNNVPRVGVQENTAGGGNPQTYLNAAGSGSVCFNCSTNSGTGGVSFSSGGATPTTVGSVGNTGNAQFNGTLQVGGTAQSTGTMSVRNNADAEVDYYLWPGLTTSQKGSFTYKDWNGNSQWYLVKDASNNWALNSAVGGLDSFKAYQSTNSGDTYVNASNSTGHIRLNYESGSGVETDIYSGSSTSLAAAFLGPTAIKMPGLAASSGHSCLQIDTSGYITPTGNTCGSGSGGGSGTVGSGTTGQIAYYSANGATVSGENAVPVTAGGTGASSASAALTNLGGAPQANLNAEISRAEAAELSAQATANAALPASGCTSSTGGNLSCAGSVTAGTTAIGVKMTAYNATTFATAVSALGALGGGTLELTGTAAITATQTIPATITVKVDENAGFLISSGKVLTMALPEAGPYQIFTGSGTVSFSTPGVALSTWWGTVGDGATDNTAAMEAAWAQVGGSSALVSLRAPAGTYLFTSTNYPLLSTAVTGFEFFGDGEGQTILALPPSMNYSLDVIWLKGWNEKLHDFSIRGATTVTGTSNITGINAYYGAFYPTIKNIECYNLNGTGTAGSECIASIQNYNQAMYATTLGTTVSSAGSATVTPASMQGIRYGTWLQIGTGGTQETISTTASTATSFTASFAYAHASTDAVVVIARGYQWITAENIYCHDSYSFTCINPESNGNVWRDVKIFGTGSNSTQHGFYVQAGDNLIDHALVQDVSGWCFQFYGESANWDQSGSVLENSQCIDPGAGHVVWASSYNNGGVSAVASGAPLSRYLTLQGNNFKNSYNVTSTSGWGISNPILVTGNTFDNASGFNSSSVTTFIGNHIYTGGVGTGAGSTITGNTFVNPSGTNAMFAPHANSIFSKNQITGVGNAGIVLYSGSTYSDNQITLNSGDTKLLTSSGTGWVFDGNTITGYSGCGSIGEITPSSLGGARIARNSWTYCNLRIDVGADNSLILDSNNGAFSWTGYIGSSNVNSDYRMGRLTATIGGYSTTINGGHLVKYDASGKLATVATTDVSFAGISLWQSTGSSGTWTAYFANQLGSIFTGLCTDGAWTAGDIGIVSTNASYAGCIHDTGSQNAIPNSVGNVTFINTGASAGAATVQINSLGQSVTTGTFTGLTDTGTASSSGYNCLQIDPSGNITKTGSACGSGGSGGGTQYFPFTAISVNGLSTSTSPWGYFTIPLTWSTPVIAQIDVSGNTTYSGGYWQGCSSGSPVITITDGTNSTTVTMTNIPGGPSHWVTTPAMSTTAGATLVVKLTSIGNGCGAAYPYVIVTISHQ